MSNEESKEDNGRGGGRQWDTEQGVTSLAWTGVIKKVSLGGYFV